MEAVEDWFGDFFRSIEIEKVKNLSDSPMPESIKAFISLGAMFTPIQLDIHRAELEKDLEKGFRRLGLKNILQMKLLRYLSCIHSNR